MHLEEAGWSASDIWSFDSGILWARDWFNAKREEVVWVKSTDEHNGKVPRQRYQSMREIIDLYDTTVGRTKFSPQMEYSGIDFAAINELAFADDVLF